MTFPTTSQWGHLTLGMMQIAQKLHAVTAPDVDGFSNERAHDLVDLQILAGELVDAPVNRATCAALFAARSAHAWPPRVVVRPGWDTRYLAEAGGLSGLAPSVDDAAAWANRLIAQIDQR